MKAFPKLFALFTVLYLAIWFTLSGTEAGFRALQIGVQQNSVLLTRVFMALGANPKDIGQDGMSVLHVAGFLGADRVIPLLIKKGAPVNLQDKDGRTALHLAAYAGNASAASALMDHQANPEIKESKGEMMALHLAVIQKHAATVQVLLEKGAQPSPEEKNSYTPLFIAEKEGLADIVAILEKFDAH